ncbi:YpfB family protein [Bacillus massilinigeriensis]|uniref:YpfB family protein n=1 Tax=Bacillus mediterraneensis TaxID=1805474 RepID=UPI0008F82DD7|nr:YpfB family protein [Bacillus mediterraneensis]
MKSFERILIKLLIIQGLFMLLSQLFLHQLNLFPQLDRISRYEGVIKEKSPETVETIRPWSSEK